MCLWWYRILKLKSHEWRSIQIKKREKSREMHWLPIWRYITCEALQHIFIVGHPILSNAYILWNLKFQEPSVDLAIQILDGTPFRPDGKIPMSVTQAKFEQKGSCHSFFLLEFFSILHCFPLLYRIKNYGWISICNFYFACCVTCNLSCLMFIIYLFLFQGINLFPSKWIRRRRRNWRKWKIGCLVGVCICLLFTFLWNFVVNILEDILHLDLFS